MVLLRGRPGYGREDGAVLVIVVLMIVALFGMVTLAVDVGALLTKRRQLVTAADAAALAAAQSCARRQGTAVANQQAMIYAQANAGAVSMEAGYPRYSPRCEAAAGTVTVRLTADQPLFFAPVLGFGRSSPVASQATASWGGAGVAEKIAPLMLSAQRLSDCNIPPDEVTRTQLAAGQGIECWFWWDNSSRAETEGALANAEWGTLDLLKWNVAPTEQCNNSTPPEFETWMFEGYAGDLSINEGDPRPPTYVCRGQGNFGARLDRLIEDAIRDGQLRYFPVNNPGEALTGIPGGQIDMDGDPCPPNSGTSCSPDKYDIIGFTRMRITDLYKGNTPEAQTYCVNRIPGASASPNARCMRAVWFDYTTEGLNPMGGENFGLVPVQLIA
ncbi:MAG TPA: pilus assembly protein TadG-related protein [Actinomycetota bacterium]|nr:pilus assembly protein TadG-related protein [Actinomycetota bacterium]